MGEKAVGPNCLNCGTQLLGKYCCNCGQKAVPVGENLLQFVAPFFDDLFNLNSRFLRSLTCLAFRPGFLSKEYVVGRRVGYAEPIKMFLFLTGVSTFLLFKFPAHFEVITRADHPVPAGQKEVEAPGNVPDPEVDPEGLKKWEEGQRKKKEPYRDFVKEKLPELWFVGTPVLAVLFRMFYQRKRFSYTDHVVFLLHFFSFVSLLSIVSLVALYSLTVLGEQDSGILLLSPVPVIVCLIYLYPAMLRFYGEGKLKTFAKFVSIIFLYGVGFIIGLLGSLLALF